MTVRAHPTKEGAWQIDCYPDGRKGKRLRMVFEGTRQAALDAEAELLNKSTIPELQHWKIKDAVPDFLDWVKVHRSPVTHADMTRSFKSRIVPHFGEYQVRMLTPEVFDRFHSWIGKARMVNNCQDYLNSLIGWMVKRKLAAPLSFRPDRMEYHKPLPLIPHPSDIQQFIDAIKSTSRILALLMFTSGARWNEVANLRWENCNLADGFARLNESATERDRFIILHGEVLEWLKSHKKPVGLCFPSPVTGKARKSITKAFQIAREKTGIKINPHLLRHAAATNMYSATEDIYAVQHFLGHAQVTTSQIYTHLSIERLKSSVNRSIDYVDKKKSEKQPKKRKVTQRGQ